ncbi:MAG: hypothetical protein IJF59_01915, partial [Clostridia bacterium]|nr:hypothetical protein [Clostridia bacterium]
MKRYLTLFLALILCVLPLCSCSSGGGEGESDESGSQNAQSGSPQGEAPQVPGEMFDAGRVKALVPEGWKGFPQKDPFSDQEGATDPDVINICKGATSDLDLLSKPFVRIDYYGPDTQMGGGLKDWYSNTEDLAPLQCGGYTWEGFTTTDYGLMAVLVTEDGDHQYQASVYLETDDGKISLADADVQAILASVAPSDGSGSGGSSAPAGEVVPTADYSWWDDDWYGWWALRNGTGIYQQPSDMGLVWDAYAEIDVYNDNTGRVTIWDTGPSKDEAMILAYDITFEAGISDLGRLVSRRVDFFPYGKWTGGMAADTMSEREVGWTVDPADSTVSHFEKMIEIKGHYVSPDNPGDSFDYYIYLRPWGILWDDVRNGNTEGCLHKDMMPLYHDNWYVSLLNLGHDRPPVSFNEGVDIINDYLASLENGGAATGGALDPAAKAGADGKVDMATLKAGLAWCKENASYDTPYDVIAAQFGV